MEQIYTIPINEAFEASAADKKCTCPFCRIYEKFEKDELDIILGASMMEPDVRMKTNELGFCRDHFSKMLTAGKRLPIALILESHLDTVADKMKPGKLLPAKSAKSCASSLEKLGDSCYICKRIEDNFSKVLDNAVQMWLSDADFRRKCSSQKCFCIPHYAAFVTAASNRMKSGDFKSFSSSVYNIEEKYLKKISDNTSFFIKKFDYRYENEPWGDAKDAVERAIEALVGHNPT